jgi:hypothetical protein
MTSGRGERFRGRRGMGFGRNLVMHHGIAFQLEDDT